LPLETLDSFFVDGTAGGTQTAALRNSFGALPTTRRVVLVTHMVDITALTGAVLGWIRVD
jgi:hypothetical protein